MIKYIEVTYTVQPAAFYGDVIMIYVLMLELLIIVNFTLKY